MTLSLDSIFTRAAGTGGKEQALYVRQEKIDDHSAFSRWRWLSRAKENRESVRNFLEAVHKHPQYQEYREHAETLLQPRLRSGKPLRERDVVAARQAMDAAMLKGTIAFGKRLCEQGILPAAEYRSGDTTTVVVRNPMGTSFGMYCVAKGYNITSKNDAKFAEALKGFLRLEITPAIVKDKPELLTHIENPEAAKTLLSRNLANGLADKITQGNPETINLNDIIDEESGSFAALLWQIEDAGTSLADLAADNSTDRALQYLHVLVNHLEVDPTDHGHLFAAICAEKWHTHPTAELYADVTGYLLNNTSIPETDYSETMEKNGLQPNLGAQLLHHPQVRDGARISLEENRGQLPTNEQTRQALVDSLKSFVGTNASSLRKFADLVKEPTPKLREALDAAKSQPLNMETLPLHINSLMEADELITLILDHNNIPEKNLLAHLYRLVEANRSAQYATEEGTIDPERGYDLLNNAFKCALAKRTGSPDQPSLDNAIAKLIPVAKELNAVNTTDRRISQKFGASRMQLLSLMGILENTMMPPNSPQDSPLKNVWNASRTEREQIEFSPAFYDFAQSLGTSLPMRDSEKKRREALIDKVLDEYFTGQNGTASNQIASAFASALTAAKDKTGLLDLDPNLIRSDVMFPQVEDLCIEWIREHPGASAEELGAKMQNDFLADAFLKLQQCISIAASLPNLSSAETKAVKAMIQRTDLREQGLIEQTVETAKSLATVFPAMMENNFSEPAVMMGLECLGKNFAPLLEYQANLKDQNERINAALILAIELAELNSDAKKALHNILNSDLVLNTSKALLYAAESQPHNPTPLATFQLLNALRLELAKQTQTSVEDNNLFKLSDTPHRSEFSALIMKTIEQLAPNTFTPVEKALGNMHEPLKPDQWDACHQVLTQIWSDNLDRNVKNGLLNHLWVNREKLVAVAKMNKGKPLDLSLMWKVITGKKAPWPLPTTELAKKLLEQAPNISVYYAALHTPY